MLYHTGITRITALSGKYGEVINAGDFAHHNRIGVTVLDNFQCS